MVTTLLNTEESFKGLLMPGIGRALLWMIKYYDLDIKNKSCVVVGRSTSVGLPLFMILNRLGGNVTLLHSRTKNPKEILRNADVVVAALGVGHYMKAEDLKLNAVVIDYGVVENEEGEVIGDFDPSGALEKGISYSPVPGGVGPVCTSALFLNGTYLWQNQHGIKREKKWIKKFTQG